jgi:phosphatidylserine/phosphatidylglycerophosphate/cardiolipin synthase-like enzyme
LHAKTAVIDQSIVFIGSMNLDPRSDSTNTELGVIINSPEFAREVLRASFTSASCKARTACSSPPMAKASNG